MTGGLTGQGRSRREMVRRQAAEMFAHDADAGGIARELRVSTKSVYQWRRAWRAGGEAALASRGVGGSPCKLDDAQLAQLRAALKAGPAAHGWKQDQRWTLARVTELIGRLFGVSCTGRVNPIWPHLLLCFGSIWEVGAGGSSTLIWPRCVGVPAGVRGRCW